MRGGRIPRIASKDRERVAVSTTAQLGSHLSFQFGSDRFGYLLASFLGRTLLAALSRCTVIFLSVPTTSKDLGIDILLT